MEDNNMVTPLENWIKHKIDLPMEATLTREKINTRQLENLRKTIAHAKKNSPFYKRHLDGFSADNIKILKDFSKLPFTTEEDIIRSGPGMMCVSQSHVERVVTMSSSGTTGDPKRLYFTREDLELTIDFFHHGMATVVRPGWNVLILMPGTLPGSIGNLLVKGLSRIDVRGIVHGPVNDPADVINDICRYDIDAIVGIPTQVLSIARHKKIALIPKNRIKGILLSADYVSRSIVHVLENHFQCPVFEHYGMTEMGLGGALSCHTNPSYHMREADLYIEIIDPDTGYALPDGLPGEIVFTTLTRTGMPLIRYRTRDYSRIINSPCPCGTILKRMEKVRPRMQYRVKTKSGKTVGMPEMDDALFSVDGVVNFNLSVLKNNNKDQFRLEIFAPHGNRERIAKQVSRNLCAIPEIQTEINTDNMESIRISFIDSPAYTTGIKKRLIADKRYK